MTSERSRRCVAERRADQRDRERAGDGVDEERDLPAPVPSGQEEVAFDEGVARHEARARERSRQWSPSGEMWPARPGSRAGRAKREASSGAASRRGSAAIRSPIRTPTGRSTDRSHRADGRDRGVARGDLGANARAMTSRRIRSEWTARITSMSLRNIWCRPFCGLCSAATVRTRRSCRPRQSPSDSSVLDVVVERLARVGHEHGLEGRRLPVVLGDHALELGRRRFGDDPAVVEDRDPLAEAFGLGQVVGREHDRCVVRRDELFDEGLHVELAARVETGGRLVQEQERRAGQQRPRDGDLLLHAPAHLLDRPVHPLLRDAQPLEDPDRLVVRRSSAFRP